jgi:sugar phosphate isomerase/epimerase
MNNRIGVMQGRLLPKYKGQYQAHPKGYWQDEFEVAAALGLDLIEFIVDLDGIEENPLMSGEGLARLGEVTALSGVSVASVCADCFMAAPLHGKDRAQGVSSLNFLRRLIRNAGQLQITDIVIPCVDQSSLRSPEDTARFVAAVETVIGIAEENGVNLSLETDLGPQEFSRLLEHFSSPKVTVNYDIGNSASLGFDVREELSSYGKRISDIHIKDRMKGGGSVLLGAGNADFDAFFAALRPLDYQGSFILQAYRDDEGIVVFKSQLEWVRPYLSAYIGGAR